jgi:hypothetical protein
MAGIEINPLIISTYARFIISQSTAIAESITLLSLPVEQLKKIASGSQQLRVIDALDPQSIAIALASPAKQIIQDGLHALARVFQTRLEKQMKDDIFMRDEHDINPNNLPKKIIDKVTAAECDNLLVKIDNHCAETFDKYQEILHTCTQTLITLLQENLIALSELESHELLFQESILDLNKRMVDLSIVWPDLNYKNFSVSDYVALKSYIAVYSALARMQMPNDEKTMQKTFKQITKLIKQTKLSDQIKTLLEDSQKNYHGWTDALPAVTVEAT